MASVAELREMDERELLDNLAAAQQELFNLRFQHVTGQLDNYARLRDLRRDIARLHTILRAREIAEAEQQDAGSGERASAAGSGDRASAAGSGDRASAAGSGERADG